MILQNTKVHSATKDCTWKNIVANVSLVSSNLNTQDLFLSRLWIAWFMKASG